MQEKLKELGRHSLVYGFGNVLSVAGGFILIPLYTHMLVTSDYGILELLNRTANVLIVFIVLGVRQAFVRFYFDHDTEDWHKTVLGTTTIFLIASSAIILALFWPMKEWVAEILFDDPVIGVLFAYIIAWIPFELILQTGLTYLQIQMKSITYVTINFFKFITFIGSNIILLYYFEMGILGVLITNIWISAVIGILFLIYIYRRSRFKFSIDLLKDLLLFGLPYLPASLFTLIIYSSDRYFLTIFSTLDMVGIYALGAKIGFIGVRLVMEPFAKVWSPFLFAYYDKDDGPQLIAKVFTIIALISTTVGLVIAIAAPIVIPLISEESYHSAQIFTPFICLASVFYGLSMMADYGVLISKKTIYKPFIFGCAALVAVVTHSILVPLYEGIGAAISFAMTMFVLFIVNFIVSNKFYKISLEIRKLFLIGVSAVIVFLVSDFIISIDPHNFYYQGLTVLSFFIYPIILWKGGLLTQREKQILLLFTSNKKGKTEI